MRRACLSNVETFLSCRLSAEDRFISCYLYFQTLLSAMIDDKLLPNCLVLFLLYCNVDSGKGDGVTNILSCQEVPEPLNVVANRYTHQMCEHDFQVPLKEVRTT